MEIDDTINSAAALARKSQESREDTPETCFSNGRVAGRMLAVLKGVRRHTRDWFTSILENRGVGIFSPDDGRPFNRNLLFNKSNAGIVTKIYASEWLSIVKKEYSSLWAAAGQDKEVGDLLEYVAAFKHEWEDFFRALAERFPDQAADLISDFEHAGLEMFENLEASVTCAGANTSDAETDHNAFLNYCPEIKKLFVKGDLEDALHPPIKEVVGKSSRGELFKDYYQRSFEIQLKMDLMDQDLVSGKESVFDEKIQKRVLEYVTKQVDISIRKFVIPEVLLFFNPGLHWFMTTCHQPIVTGDDDSKNFEVSQWQMAYYDIRGELERYCVEQARNAIAIQSTADALWLKVKSDIERLEPLYCIGENIPDAFTKQNENLYSGITNKALVASQQLNEDVQLAKLRGVDVGRKILSIRESNNSELIPGHNSNVNNESVDETDVSVPLQKTSKKSKRAATQVEDKKEFGSFVAGFKAHVTSEVNRAIAAKAPKRKRKFGHEGNGLKGPKTLKMKEQKRTFDAFLKKNPVDPGHSRITRAHQCWGAHPEWNKAAKASGDNKGYASYKTLAQAK